MEQMKHKTKLTLIIALLIVISANILAGTNEWYQNWNNPLYSYSGGLQTHPETGTCTKADYCYNGNGGHAIVHEGSSCTGTSTTVQFDKYTRNYEVDSQGTVSYTTEFVANPNNPIDNTLTVWSGDQATPGTYTPTGFYSSLQ
jgi:hypothetical protein